MAKPTFLQSLLNKPTQSYAFPAAPKDYHSQKRDLQRIAKAFREAPADTKNCATSTSSTGTPAGNNVQVRHDGTFSLVLGYEQELGPSSDPIQPLHKHPQYKVVCDSRSSSSSSCSDDSEEDIFYTPNSSPRTSWIDQSPHTVTSLIPLPPSLRPSLVREDSVDSMTATTSDYVETLTSLRTDSTRLTTPVASDAGDNLPEASRCDVTTLPRRSATRTNKSSSDWSKDVRWLVPPVPMSFTSAPKRRAMYDVPVQPKPSRQRRSKPQSQVQPLLPTSHVQRRPKSVSSRKTKIVTSMTALLEVEEPSESTNELHHALMGRDRTRTLSLIQTPSKLHLNSQSSRSRVSSTSSMLHPEHNHPPRSQYTTSSRTVTLPSPLPITSTSYSTHAQNLPSSGTPGYTSLVLPRAAYPSSSKTRVSTKLGFGFGVLGSGEVDLTKGGMAQTTMATVEVVRGIAEAGRSGLASNSATKAARRKTLSKSFTMPTFLRGSGSFKGKEKATMDDESPLAFTSWRKPPGYVGANGVLVQVWAVGVDAVDQVLVKGATLPLSSSSDRTSPSASSSSSGKKNTRKKESESTKKADVGFIPGRSFVGRVVECGWEVGEEVIKKNDWVVGLSDVKKCGAMAEFIVEDRRRLHRVPYPRMPTNSANPDTILHSHALTLEEFALLPLTGVPAHRAVCTFASVEAEAKFTPRALVLSGHDGAGAVAVQMLARRGWRVSVHVPVPTRIPVIPGVSQSYIDDDSRTVAYFEETEAVIQSWGAEEVFFVPQHDDDADGRDGAIMLMNRLMEAAEVFDGILDTIGGKEIWDVGEALLSCRSSGGEVQFTTLVGDTPERIVPSTSDLFKAGVRSTKTHGTGSSAASRRHSVDSVLSDGRKSKAKAKVGYAWVIINQDVDWQGGDIADSLRAVIREAAVQEGVRPLVAGGKIVPFEKTPEVFVGDILGSGGTAVVKVVG